MKLRATITITYEVTDHLDERQRAYGTTDPDEMAAIDAEADPVDILAGAAALGDDVTFTVVALKEGDS